jgi:hypothetical protein
MKNNRNNRKNRKNRKLRFIRLKNWWTNHLSDMVDFGELAEYKMTDCDSRRFFLTYEYRKADSNEWRMGFVRWSEEHGVELTTAPRDVSWSVVGNTATLIEPDIKTDI